MMLIRFSVLFHLMLEISTCQQSTRYVSCDLICLSCDHHVIHYRCIILWMVRLTSWLVKMEA